MQVCLSLLILTLCIISCLLVMHYLIFPFPSIVYGTVKVWSNEKGIIIHMQNKYNLEIGAWKSRFYSADFSSLKICSLVHIYFGQYDNHFLLYLINSFIYWLRARCMQWGFEHLMMMDLLIYDTLYLLIDSFCIIVSLMIENLVTMRHLA